MDAPPTDWATKTRWRPDKGIRELVMPVLIPTIRLQSICDPFETNPWGNGSITRQMVRAAILDKNFVAHPIPVSPLSKSRPTRDHIGRIAYLAVNGWTDAISIDVGVPTLGGFVDWMIQDGNHRFAAALYRGDPDILATVDGDVNYAHTLFGVDVVEYGW